MSEIKEILCMHHSHLDIGYTHPQPLLMELQVDYINQAIKLCQETEEYPEESKFRWTCEATYPVLKWIETASSDDIALFKKYLANGQLSISAMLAHATPLNNYHQLERMLLPIKLIQEKLDVKISTAINHDVNGQPWPVTQALLDAGINFYITGINVHFGGIPFKRPTAFQWQTPDNRHLLTFQGEHYSLFSQFFETSKADTRLMARGIREYVERLESDGYEHDFIFLTATNPPLYDNNSPDFQLANLIKRFNEEGHGYKIRFVTPEMLLDRVKKIDSDEIPMFSGDWTDYWNFGSGSSATMTKLNRKTKLNIQSAELLESFQGSPNLQYNRVKEESLLNMLLFEEHTWGASHSITNPDDMEARSQKNHKAHMAYQAADLSAYVLGKQMEELSDNPIQSNEPEGILLFNPTDVEQETELYLPKKYLEIGRHLSALRMKDYLPYSEDISLDEYIGVVSLPPFTYRKIPFTKMNEMKSNISKSHFTVVQNMIETPYYIIEFNPENGRIVSLYDKERSWSMLDETSEWNLFEYVHETIDTRHHLNERATFFPRDIDLGNKSISVWNHDWKPKRKGPEKVESWEIKETVDSITYSMSLSADGVTQLKQDITFSAYNETIKFDVEFNKLAIKEPESIYFAVPLNVKKNWRCIYDTAGLLVELDKEQMGNVSKDWLTVDRTVSIFDDEQGVTLACPDAPLVQVGDFNFGKESKYIPRDEKPLLLAWTMNNYWDTNFWATQEGKSKFRYELTPFTKYNAENVYKSGISAKSPVLMNAVIDCKKDEQHQLIQCEGENVVVEYIKPAEDSNGFIVTVRNLTAEKTFGVLSLPHGLINSADLVNTLETKTSTIDVESNKVHFHLEGKQVIRVRLTHISEK